MKFDKQVEAFIALRIQGKSFDEISIELKTSKKTLLEWNKKFDVRTFISEEKALKTNALIKSFQMDRENRLKAYLEFSKKVNEELMTRDLSQIPTDKLLTMAITSEERIFSINGKFIQMGLNQSYYVVGENEDGFFNFPLDD